MYNPRSELAIDFNIELAARPAPENLTQQERRKRLLQVQNEMRNNHRAVYVKGLANIQMTGHEGGDGIPWR
jgi:hypothetical protein